MMKGCVIPMTHLRILANYVSRSDTHYPPNPPMLPCPRILTSLPCLRLLLSRSLSLKVRWDDPSLGFVFGVYSSRYRAFIVDIQRDSTTSKIKDWRHKYRGAYIVEANTHPVFTVEDSTRLLSAVRDSSPYNTAPVFTVVLAPDTPPSKATQDTGIPHLQMAQFCTAISALYEIGEGKKIPRDALDGDDVLSTATNVILDG
jgi:hypothetical protein